MAATSVFQSLLDRLPAALSNGRLKVEAVNESGTPLTVNTRTTSKGYQQLTSTAAAATIASLCSGAALPSGATRALIIPTADVRLRDDGDPSATLGIPVASNQPFTYDGDTLATLKVYGAATLDVWFYA